MGEIFGKLAIFAAIVTWLIEIPDRPNQKHYTAWQIINAAYGKHGDSGRTQALQDLNNDEVSLEGIDLSNAGINGAELRGADLRQVIFANTQMNSVNFGCRKFLTRIVTSKYQKCTVFYDSAFDTPMTNSNLKGADINSVTISREYNVDGFLFLVHGYS